MRGTVALTMPRKIVVPTMSQKTGLVNAPASGRASTLCQLLDISDFNSALRKITHRRPLLSIPDFGSHPPVAHAREISSCSSHHEGNAHLLHLVTEFQLGQLKLFQKQDTGIFR